MGFLPLQEPWGHLDLTVVYIRGGSEGTPAGWGPERLDLREEGA